MREYYDLQIDKEDYEKVVKYFLESNQEFLVDDLRRKGKLYKYRNVDFYYVKGEILRIYKAVDYFLLDKFKYYNDYINKDLKRYLAVINSEIECNVKDSIRMIVYILYDLDMNENNCLQKEWYKLWDKR